MRTTTMRRLGAVIIAPAFVAGALAAAPAAQAATQNAPEKAAGTWLAAQVANEDHLFVSSSDFGDFTDYGLNLDIYSALTKVGASAAAEAVYTAAVAHADDYTDSTFDEVTTRYAGAVGKLAATVQAHGDDAADVAGRDLIAELETLIVSSGDDAGRAKDAPDGPFQSTSVLNQGWAVRALANADSGDATAATDYLLKQQCNDGSFRASVSGTPCTTSTGTVDGTAFALSSLAIAEQAGVSGLQDDIDDAADWLVSVQAADGSFLNDGAANANSTGLASTALATAGRDADAREGAEWVASRQVLSDPERGAIAFNDDALAAADNGIAKNDRDQFVRSSVQAVLALSSLPADVSPVDFTVDRYVQAGKTSILRASGLRAGEPFTALLPRAVVRGRASSTGAVKISFLAPVTSGSRAVTLVGSRLGRESTTTVTVLAARKLTTSVRSKAIKAKGRQQVVVRNLQPGEPYQIRYRGKQLATGKANSAGRVIYSFSVGGSKGRKTIYLKGLFAERRGSASFTVK